MVLLTKIGICHNPSWQIYTDSLINYSAILLIQITFTSSTKMHFSQPRLLILQFLEVQNLNPCIETWLNMMKIGMNSTIFEKSLSEVRFELSIELLFHLCIIQSQGVLKLQFIMNLQSYSLRMKNLLLSLINLIRLSIQYPPIKESKWKDFQKLNSLMKILNFSLKIHLLWLKNTLCLLKTQILQLIFIGLQSLLINDQDIQDEL